MDISNQNKKIQLKTFKWMMERVQKHIQIKKRPPEIVYLDPRTKTDHITYERFSEMLQRYKKFINEKGREPKYLNILPPKKVKNGIGFWLWSSDMDKIEKRQLKNVNDILLNETAIEKPNLSRFLDNCGAVRVHGWIQCLKDKSGWHPPTKETLDNILRKAGKIVNLGFDGVHLDYIRYPGTAYKYTDATEKITGIVRSVYEYVKSINDDIIVSAAVMPELGANPRLYGQDYAKMGKWLDVIIPMAYKGNYKANREWIGHVTEYIREKSGISVWTGLQSYKSDNDPTPLPASELREDMRVALDNGADACILFRYGLIDESILCE